MKKIELSRHVDLGDKGHFSAGQQVVSDEIYSLLKQDKRTRVTVIEDLDSKATNSKEK